MSTSNGSKWKQFVVAALASALASLFIVAVGPGFSQENAPNENAADQAVEATSDDTSTETTETAAEPATPGDGEPVGSNASENAGADNDGVPNGGGNGDDTPENASSAPDSHGHVGAGTGTTTGSQADPGHKEDENGSATDGKSIGDGRGDDSADECTNTRHQGADAPQGGANYNPGFYDNTCDGDHSENGNLGNDAPGGGTPCAGCVGNADDKNPPGQVKEANGTKSNDMGYECDGNQGVGAHYGRGNPAHTGQCGGDTTTPPTLTSVCRNVNGTWTIVNNTTLQAGDKPMNAAECQSSPTPESVCRNVNGTWTIVNNTTRQPGDKDADASQCDEDDTTVLGSVCRHVNGEWVIVNNTTRQPGDKDADASQCDEDDTTVLESVCRHVNGEWVVVTNTTRQPGDKDADASQCDEDDNTPPGRVTICHATGSATNPYVVITVSENALKNGHDDTHGDLNPVNAALCTTSTPPPCPTDMNPFVDGLQCVPPETCPSGPMQGQIPPGGDLNACTTSNPPCPTDMNPYVDGLQCVPPEVCPSGPMQGQVPPGGNMALCNPTTPPPCPSDMNPFVDGLQCVPPETCPSGPMQGQVPPGGNMALCNPSNPPCPTDMNPNVDGLQCVPPETCPSGPLAGQVPPGGNMANCNPVVAGETCPADSDFPGMPVFSGNNDGCNGDDDEDDEVLGDTLTNDGDADGGGNDDNVGAGNESQERPQGAVMPFTGTSVLAYVLIGLQMIGAGALIARGRKRNNR